jgi:hypothetical protein
VRVQLKEGDRLADARSLTDDQLKAATGYAVHRVGDVGSSGQEIYYRGGQLGEDLTIGHLREHWRSKNPKNESAQQTSAVDELHLMIGSAVLGAGTPAFAPWAGSLRLPGNPDV